MLTPEEKDTHTPEVKEWTVMFYFASDNPLASTIVSQLKAIKDAGYHPEANVLAQFDPYIVKTPAHIFDVSVIHKLKDSGRSRVGFVANDSYVRSLVGDKLWDEENEDLIEDVQQSLRVNGDRAAGDGPGPNGGGNGDGAARVEGQSRAMSNGGGAGRGCGPDYRPPRPSAAMSGEQQPMERLSQFLEFCRENYPARHYMLLILGHGLAVSNDLFLFDEHGPQKTLLLPQLAHVLRQFRCDIEADEVKGQFELVGFHSCSMSALEVAYELRNTANFMLSSQGPAFVGSWPYRQILLRIFNSLNAGLTASDINPDALAEEFKAAKLPVTNYLRELCCAETKALLDQHEQSQPPCEELRKALLRELNGFIRNPRFHLLYPQGSVKLSEETRGLLGQRLNGANRRRLNRLLLADAYPQEIERNPKTDVADMIRRIFYYCLHNSQDFQLAGYSFDICLCDLTKVDERATAPLKRLAEALTEGLKDARAKELILLSHWDAQSFWQETYTDIYDFCFCLRRRCLGGDPSVVGPPPEDPEKLSPALRAIHDACECVMEKLQRGRRDDNDKLVVRAESAGPLYQYAHGLSVFFPWSEPIGSSLWDEQYEQYRFNKKVPWMKFLREYFKSTMRVPRDNEQDKREKYADLQLNEILLQRIASGASNSVGHLGEDGKVETIKAGPHDPAGKAGPNDPAGKAGPNDPAGNDLDFPGIKNYPPFTRLRVMGEAGGGHSRSVRNGPKPAEQPGPKPAAQPEPERKS